MRCLVEKSRIKMGGGADPIIVSLIYRALKQQMPFKSAALMGKKMKGRKRHIVTDTQGHLLHVKVHAANIHDTVSGCKVCEQAVKKCPALKGVCADAGGRKTMEECVDKVRQKIIEISQRMTPGGAVLAKRWIVERTFAWMNHFRRLSKDYEISTKTEGNFVMIAQSRLS